MADRYWNRDRFGGDYGSEEMDYDRGYESAGSRYRDDEDRDEPMFGRYERDRDYGSQFDTSGRGPGSGRERAMRTPDFGREGYGTSRYGMNDRDDAGEFSGRQSMNSYEGGRDSFGRDRDFARSDFGRSSGYDRSRDLDRDRYASHRNYGSTDSGDRNSFFDRDDDAFDNSGNVGVPGYGTAYGGWSGNYDSTGTRTTSGSTGRDMGTAGTMGGRDFGRGATGNFNTRSSYGGGISGGGNISNFGGMTGNVGTGARDFGTGNRGLGSDYGSSMGQSYRGRGPKGFQRSDERIREMVCERLEDHDAVDASDIEVMVSGGEVTLTGHVPDRQMKRMAEDVAESIPGVRDVNNDLKVNRSLLGRVAEGVRSAVAGITESNETSDRNATDATSGSSGATGGGNTARTTTGGATRSNSRNRR